ncbi:MAG: hypothetical protein OIN86_12990 [Candidatus Methanoperedens sp.]|nr:hypothetical protein [Candidatus Methanoperedens sp.]CAG0948731.1 hypothetical protein METP1_00052 [Methanosarcinales archaeon]
MTKTCTLKESFIKKQLDKFQPGWKDGEDITQETKNAIKEYAASKMSIMDDTECITDYSIWHMANKIRERENLPKPKKTNKGNVKVSESEPSKVGESKPSDEKVDKEKNDQNLDEYIENELLRLIKISSWNKVMDILESMEASDGAE